MYLQHTAGLAYPVHHKRVLPESVTAARLPRPAAMLPRRYTMNMPAKPLTDIFMLSLFLLLMAASHTGSAAHEWLGVLLTVLFVIHTRLNLGWYKSLARGRYNVTRAVRLLVNALLLLAMLGTLASAVLISRTVFAFLGFKGELAFRTFHVFCAHWCFLLAAVHFGMYGRRFLSSLERPAAFPRPLGYRLASCGLGMALALYGIHAFRQRELFFPLTMQSSFMLWSDDAVLFLLDYGAVFFLGAWLTIMILSFPHTMKKFASPFIKK